LLIICRVYFFNHFYVLLCSLGSTFSPKFEHEILDFTQKYEWHLEYYVCIWWCVHMMSIMCAYDDGWVYFFKNSNKIFTSCKSLFTHQEYKSILWSLPFQWSCLTYVTSWLEAQVVPQTFMQPKIGKLNTCEELVQHRGLSRASHKAPSFPHH